MATLYGMEFNYSYFVITIIVTAIVVMLIGTLQYKIHRGRIRRRYNDRMFGFILSIFVITSIIALLMGNVMNGLVLFMDEHFLALGDDSAWSVFLALGSVIAASIIASTVLFLLGKGTSSLSKRAIIKLYC